MVLRHKRWALILYVLGLFFVLTLAFGEAGTVTSGGVLMAMGTLGDVRWGAARGARIG